MGHCKYIFKPGVKCAKRSCSKLTYRKGSNIWSGKYERRAETNHTVSLPRKNDIGKQAKVWQTGSRIRNSSPVGARKILTSYKKKATAMDVYSNIVVLFRLLGLTYVLNKSK